MHFSYWLVRSPLYWKADSSLIYDFKQKYMPGLYSALLVIEWRNSGTARPKSQFFPRSEYAIESTWMFVGTCNGSSRRGPNRACTFRKGSPASARTQKAV